MLNIGKMFFIISLSDSNCCRCISKKCSSKISSFNHARMAWLPGRSRSLKKAGVYFSPEVIEKARMELDTHSHIFVGSTSFLRPFAFLKQWSLLVFKSCLSKGQLVWIKMYDTYQRIFWTEQWNFIWMKMKLRLCRSFMHAFGHMGGLLHYKRTEISYCLFRRYERD